MGIFDSLHIGYSGLSTSQAGINTTSHNISNANTDGYSRQRISQKVNPSIHNIPGDVGNGVHVETITRVHDEFVYMRMKSSSAKLEYNEFTKDTLQEITQYLPDLQDNGIANDLKSFFNDWSNVAQYPGDSSQKVLLSQSTQNLSRSIKETKNTLEDVKTRLNENFKASVDEVNKIAEEIANINKDINRVESTYQANANDLRDHRDELELRLSKLIDATVFKGKIHTDNSIDRSLTDQGKDYNINIAGFNIVDGASFHPLVADDSASDAKINSLYFIDHNSQKVDITSKIKNGKVGAIVALRGDGVDAEGKATNSKLQSYIDNLDSFAKGLIENVNSIYAQSPQNELVSSDLTGLKSDSNVLSKSHINEGSFDLIVYNELGEEVAKRAINIDSTTKFDDGTDTSIIGQINQNRDDNGDNDATNDIDDFFEASYGQDTLSIKPLKEGYRVAISDNGTNFAGVLGMHQFFRGENASDIDLASKLSADSSKIQSFKSPIDGNNEVANQMVALQHASLRFDTPNGTETTNTIEGFYRGTTAQIASDAGAATSNYEASKVLHQTVEEQMNSVSGVDMDEELVNLMKYQTAYQASAKVITAIDEMVNTLLGMK
jgi:flagellar hook-associated protein 1 FlgK